MKYTALKSKKFLAPILLLPLLVVIVFWLARDDNKKVISYNPVCDDDLLSQANINIEPPNTLELSKVIDKIQKLDGHDSDPNCLYVIIKYNLQIGNLEGARSNLDKLKVNYQTEKLNKIIFFEGGQKQLLQALEQQISDLNIRNDKNKKQVIMNVEGPAEP